MRRKYFAATLSLIFLLSPVLTLTANAHWEFHDVYGQYLFGYTGVESAYEYENEVKNINHIKTNVTTLSSEWTTNLSGDFNLHNGAGNKVAIFLDNILFQSDTPAWYLRPDYRYVFDYWYNINKAYLTSDRVAFLIISSEANNARIPNASIDTATAYVKSKLPALPTVVGYGFGDGAVDVSGALPVQPDGFAFWRYATLHPEDPTTQFQQRLTYFKTHIDVSRQRLIIVFDAHFAPYHLAAGITQDMLGPMAVRYANIAHSEPLVVGMVGFTWQGFGDTLGLRDVAQGVRDYNRQASCILLPCP